MISIGNEGKKVSSLFVSASNLTRNSPIFLGWYDLPPAGDN
jgi:hypothetical protein